MPRRKRPKTTTNAPTAPDPTSTDDTIERFAAALRRSEAQERAERQRERAEREHTEVLAAARRDLDRAIEAARAARAAGSGVADADEAWRVAKARVIELETGDRPEWAGPDVETGDDAVDAGAENVDDHHDGDHDDDHDDGGDHDDDGDDDRTSAADDVDPGHDEVG